MIVLVINLSAFVYLFVQPPLLKKDVLNIVVTGCALFAFVLCAMAPIKYVRLDFEKDHTAARDLHDVGNVQADAKTMRAALAH